MVSINRNTHPKTAAQVSAVAREAVRIISENADDYRAVFSVPSTSFSNLRSEKDFENFVKEAKDSVRGVTQDFTSRQDLHNNDLATFIGFRRDYKKGTLFPSSHLAWADDQSRRMGNGTRSEGWRPVAEHLYYGGHHSAQWTENLIPMTVMLDLSFRKGENHQDLSFTSALLKDPDNKLGSRVARTELPSVQDILNICSGLPYRFKETVDETTDYNDYKYIQSEDYWKQRTRSDRAGVVTVGTTQRPKSSRH